MQEPQWVSDEEDAQPEPKRTPQNHEKVDSNACEYKNGVQNSEDASKQIDVKEAPKQPSDSKENVQDDSQVNEPKKQLDNGKLQQPKQNNNEDAHQERWSDEDDQQNQSKAQQKCDQSGKQQDQSKQIKPQDVSIQVNHVKQNNSLDASWEVSQVAKPESSAQVSGQIKPKKEEDMKEIEKQPAEDPDASWDVSMDKPQKLENAFKKNKISQNETNRDTPVKSGGRGDGGFKRRQLNQNEDNESGGSQAGRGWQTGGRGGGGYLNRRQQSDSGGFGGRGGRGSGSGRGFDGRDQGQGGGFGGRGGRGGGRDFGDRGGFNDRGFGGRGGRGGGRDFGDRGGGRNFGDRGGGFGGRSGRDFGDRGGFGRGGRDYGDRGGFGGSRDFGGGRFQNQDRGFTGQINGIENGGTKSNSDNYMLKVQPYEPSMININELSVIEAVKKSDNESKTQQFRINTTMACQPLGLKSWPGINLYVRRTRINFTLSRINDHICSIIFIPYSEYYLDFYPGNIVNQSKFDYKKKLREKEKQVGAIYLQKCFGLPNFDAFAFTKVQKDPSNQIQEIMRNLVKESASIDPSKNNNHAFDSILIPYEKKLGKLKDILSGIIAGLEDYHKFKEIIISTKSMQAFAEGAQDFVGLIQGFAQRNDLVME